MHEKTRFKLPVYNSTAEELFWLSFYFFIIVCEKLRSLRFC